MLVVAIYQDLFGWHAIIRIKDDVFVLDRRYKCITMQYSIFVGLL